MSTWTYDVLTEITTIGTTAAAVYTNPSSTTTFVRSITLHNGNTDVETVKLYLVPDSGGAVGTAGTTNKIFEREMEINETFMIEIEPPGWILSDTNDTIQAVTDTGSKVTIMIFGSKET